MRSSGWSVDSVHASSHGMQNIAATVWLRNVTTDRLCFPDGQGMSTYRWMSVFEREVIGAPLRASSEDPQGADSSGKVRPCQHSSVQLISPNDNVDRHATPRLSMGESESL